MNFYYFLESFLCVIIRKYNPLQSFKFFGKLLWFFPFFLKRLFLLIFVTTNPATYFAGVASYTILVDTF